jgi:methionine-rich copper-binding protein CopC
MIRFAALMLALSSAAPSSMHFSLVKSTPAADQTVTAPMTRVQIWFSEAPAPVVSQIKILGADKAAVPVGKTLVDKDKSIYTDLASPLAPGAYVVSWRAAGDDGHVLSGEIKFKIAKK